jgi:hypothetical protein
MRPSFPHLSFLTPPQVLLTPEGRSETLRFETVEGGGALASFLKGGRPNVWLARSLCAYQHFDPGAARGGAAWAAARLHAASAAPFVQAGALVEKSGRGFSIWWWDRERVDPILAEAFGDRPPPLGPETFVPPVGGGWRVLRLTDGVEAQLWRDGGLVASRWRRGAFDAASWEAFVRIQPGPGDAPSEPPAALAGFRAPFPRYSAGGGLIPEHLLRAAPAALAVLLLTAAAFWLGQGLKLRSQSQDLERVAALERRAAPAPVVGSANAARRLAAFTALSERPNLVAATGVATRILRLYGVGIEGVDAQGDTLNLTLPYSTLASVDRIARDMEASGVFTDVRPLTNAADHTLQLRMRLTGRPETAAALNPDG